MLPTRRSSEQSVGLLTCGHLPEILAIMWTYISGYSMSKTQSRSSRRRSSAAPTGLHQPERIKLARPPFGNRGLPEGSGQSGKLGWDEVCPRDRLTRSGHLPSRRLSSSKSARRPIKISRQEDAIIVVKVLYESSDSEVLDWNMSCYLIEKRLLAKMRSTHTSILF
jgi:hypothetical protein